MAGVTAFIIGAGASVPVGFAAGNGKLNWLAIGAIAFAGLVVAARDYRSLKKLPPLDNGGYKAMEQAMRTYADTEGNQAKDKQ